MTDQGQAEHLTAVAGDLVILSPDDIRTDTVVLIRGALVVDIVPATAAMTVARRIGGPGRIVLPGLINLHSHTPLMAVRGLEHDLLASAAAPGFVLNDEEIAAFSRLGALEQLSMGCTAVVDHYRAPHAILPGLRESGLRAWIGGRIHDADPQARAAGGYAYDTALGRRTLAETEALIDAIADGDPLLTPVVAVHALDTCSPDLLREAARLVERTRAGLHLHLAQSEAELAQLRARDNATPVEMLQRTGLLGPWLVGAHGIYLTSDERKRLAEARAALVHNPIGNARSGQYAKAFGMDRLGIRIGLGIDALNGDMFEAMRQAVALARLLDPGSRPTTRDAFAWATIGAADILGRPDLGRIAPGCAADLVVLDATRPNLAPWPRSLDAVVWNATAANVETVLIGGIVRWQEALPELDRDRIVREARSAADALVASGRLGRAVSTEGGWTWLAI